MNPIEPKPTYQTSYFRIFIGCALLGPPLLIGFIALANGVLPVEDAQAFKAPLLGAWATLLGASGIATLFGGVVKTVQKAQTQKALVVGAQAVQTLTQGGPEQFTTGELKTGLAANESDFVDSIMPGEPKESE